MNRGTWSWRLAARGLGAALAGAAGAMCHAQWTQVGGSPERGSSTMSVVPSLAAPTWTCSQDQFGNDIGFVPQGGLAASADAVFAVGSVSPPGGPEDQWRVFAVSRVTGQVIWSGEVSEPYNESNSAPTIDTVNSTVIVASGPIVTAFRLADGGVAWQTSLTGQVVNANPLITTDRPGRNRVFITDYGGLAGLYCIDADPYEAETNPYHPGDLVWQVAIGTASGASPTYLSTSDGGRVYVATFSFGSSPGQVQCFPAGATSAPAPIWTTSNTIQVGFFGGVCVRSVRGSAASVFAASYAFFGGPLAANLLKLDALSGAVRWSVPCNRTDAIPVPLDDGGVLLSGGIAGNFGTVRSLALFHDQGTGAGPVWDTGTTLTIGGRLAQPTAIQTPAGLRVLCAAGAAGGTAGDDEDFSTDLFVIDPQQSPGSPGFVVDQFTGGGGGAIVANGNVYTIGSAGLIAFGPVPASLDVNHDGEAGVDDVYAWEEGMGSRDVDRSGTVDGADLARLVSELRAFEVLDMTKGRP